jgi:phage gp36-like protein
MGYTTPAEVRALLTPGGGDAPMPEENGTAATMSNADLQEQIELAEAYIDSRLSTHYAIPLPEPIPLLIKQVAAAMAAWHATLSYRQSADIEFNDPVSHRYRWAQQVLNELESGKSELYPTPEVGSSDVFNQYEGELFSPQEFGIRQADPYRGEYGSWGW